MRADGAEVGADVVGVGGAGLEDDRRAQGALLLHQVRDGRDGDAREREADRDEAAGHDELRAAA